MMKATKLAQITREFRNYNRELLGLSETRWKGSGVRRLSIGETLFYSEKPETEDHSSGVGFLLSKEAKLCLTGWNPISDRIISLRLATKVRHFTFIQVYAPTEQAPDDVKDAFNQQLAHTLNSVKKSDIVVLMGDLNTQVVKLHSTAPCTNFSESLVLKADKSNVTGYCYNQQVRVPYDRTITLFNNRMQFYNKSLRFAVERYENFSLAYANRSACFLHMQMYDECLADIELARQSNYPQRLMSKLNQREAECFKLMEESKEVGSANIKPVLSFIELKA